MRARYIREAIHSVDIDQNLFYRSRNVCIVTSNRLLYYICDSIVLQSNTK